MKSFQEFALCLSSHHEDIIASRRASRTVDRRWCWLLPLSKFHIIREHRSLPLNTYRNVSLLVHLLFNDEAAFRVSSVQFKRLNADFSTSGYNTVQCDRTKGRYTHATVGDNENMRQQIEALANNGRESATRHFIEWMHEPEPVARLLNSNICFVT